jgi:hypothetical protein
MVQKKKQRRVEKFLKATMKSKVISNSKTYLKEVRLVPTETCFQTSQLSRSPSPMMRSE